MQWGILQNVSFNQTFNRVAFPLTFTNSVFNVQATLSSNTAADGSIGVFVKDMKLSGCYICGDNSDTPQTGNIMWTAIGY